MPRPAYPQVSGSNIFQKVKAETDLVALAEEFTVLLPAGANYKGICPLHEEKTASFYVYNETQTWHCFGACGRGGDVIEFVRLLMELGRWQ